MDRMTEEELKVFEESLYEWYPKLLITTMITEIRASWEKIKELNAELEELHADGVRHNEEWHCIAREEVDGACPHCGKEEEVDNGL